MSLFVELALSNPRLVLTPTIDLFPDTSISVEFQPVMDSSPPKMIFSIQQQNSKGFVDALNADPTIQSWQVIDEFDGTQFFRVDVMEDAELISSDVLEEGVRFLTAETEGHEWRITTVVRDHEALQTLQTHLREKDIDYRLIRLHDAEQTATSATLTETQRETLIEAYRAGYFEIPRHCSLEDVADRLGISESAVSQRIRRAFARIVESELLKSRPD